MAPWISQTNVRKVNMWLNLAEYNNYRTSKATVKRTIKSDLTSDSLLVNEMSSIKTCRDKKWESMSCCNLSVYLNYSIQFTQQFQYIAITFFFSKLKCKTKYLLIKLILILRINHPHMESLKEHWQRGLNAYSQTYIFISSHKCFKFLQGCDIVYIFVYFWSHDSVTCYRLF